MRVTAFRAVVAFSALGPLMGCTFAQGDREVGEVVSYSSIYELPIVAKYHADGSVISTNTDLLRRYQVSASAGYSYSVDDNIVFQLPNRPLRVGDTWSVEQRSFEFVQQVEDVLLIVSSWRGKAGCIDSWKTGNTNILFSTEKGILSLSNELLDCTTDNIVGYSTSHFSGTVWSPR